MTGLLGHVLLVGVGGGASPVAATVCIVLLSTSRPLATALAFLLGHSAVLASVGVAAFSHLGGLFGSLELAPAARHAVDAAIGLLLLALVLVEMLARPTAGAPARWAAAAESVTPVRAFLFGTARMATDVGALALFVSGLKEIVAADLGVADSVAVFAVLVLFIEMALVVPIAVYAASPIQGGAALGTARRWLEANAGAVAAGVFAVFGVLLLAKGVAGLLV